MIDLWPSYAEVAYDSSNALHEEIAMEWLIAIMWRRGGTATTIDEVKWDQVVGPNGMIEKLKLSMPNPNVLKLVPVTTSSSLRTLEMSPNPIVTAWPFPIVPGGPW